MMPESCLVSSLSLGGLVLKGCENSILPRRFLIKKVLI